MKKNIFTVTLALLLALALPAAFAADARIEELEHKGFGVLKLEFSRDCTWYEEGRFTLSSDGAEVPFDILAGEEEDAWLYAPALSEGGNFALNFTLGETSQTLSFEALTGVKYVVYRDGEVIARADDDRCDFCRERGHDEDFCPERIDPAEIPADPRDVARYFDIDDFCERCGGIGHDDDRCRE